jgi:hypothetical protein
MEPAFETEICEGGTPRQRQNHTAAGHHVKRLHRSHQGHRFAESLKNEHARMQQLLQYLGINPGR